MNEETLLAAFVREGVERLYEDDPALADILEEEYRRQTETLVMVASCTPVDPSVLACEAMVPVNVTAEGYPGRRYHAGCRVIDGIEQLAIDRAKAAFGARYANVQPHSATTANYAVLSSLLRPGDRILGMELDFGGHLTHGARVAYSGTYFESHGYGLDAEGKIDYDEAGRVAREVRPKLIICGATAYPRQVDFARFREIADEVGAWLLADISHVAGLVAAGLHPSPIDHAHITTTCTHKQLYGPRGGLILLGRDAEAPAPDGRQTLSELMQKAIFPFFQGAPILNAIAAKARALDRVMSPEFRRLGERIVADSRALAGYLMSEGWRVLSGGSDNHIVLFDVAPRGLTGLIAEEALEDSGIVVNKNRIPGDTKPPLVTSGVRLGTNTMALRGMEPEEVVQGARLVHRVLTAVEPRGDREYRLAPAVRDEVRAEVAALCRKFPIPRYPLQPAAVPS
jgi:glycine hydroxymethyltransferase